jgi:hypothetical protein
MESLKIEIGPNEDEREGVRLIKFAWADRNRILIPKLPSPSSVFVVWLILKFVLRIEHFYPIVLNTKIMLNLCYPFAYLWFFVIKEY